MVKSLLNKLGSSLAKGVCALALLVGVEANADEIRINSLKDLEIVGIRDYSKKYPDDDYSGSSVKYQGATTFTNSMTRKQVSQGKSILMIYTADFPEYEAYNFPIGALEGDGVSVSGYFNQEDDSRPGMGLNQTINTSNTTVINGKLRVYIKGENGYGVYNSSIGEFGELIPDKPGYLATNINIGSYTPFGQFTNGTFSVSGNFSYVPKQFIMMIK